MNNNRYVWKLSQSICALVLALAFAGNDLAAQCERVGWVVGSTPGCGVKIIDLDNGNVIRAVTGGDALTGGKTIRFSTVPATLPGGCTADGMEIVALTCVSDTLPCKAEFAHATSNLNAFSLTFEADIYDASSQFCKWTFGDGATAEGKSTQHTFPQEGTYPVCLTVSDAFGCSVQDCQQIFVSAQNPNWCDYDVYVTAVGTQLYGKIFPLENASGTLTSIKWYNSNTSEILAETTDFTHELPGFGHYLICAQYEVTDSVSGGTCTTTRCQQLTVADPACVNPELASLSNSCPSLYAPVCSCEGITYGNECEAMAAGVTTWWAGECGAGTGNCSADLKIELVGGNPDAGYDFKFTNLSAGDFSLVQLDFGDGSPIWEGSQWSTVLHHYAEGGIYRTNLTAWKNNSCVSSANKLLVTDAYYLSCQNLPDGTDYVMPGDANGDQKANMYDLLNIGLAHAATGAPRPNATTSWTPQFAPNWPQAVVTGVNYKHLDCDGNGLVNNSDVGPVQQHYVPIDTTEVSWQPSVPKIKVVFSQDTLYVNPNNPTALQINADVLVDAPILNLYGLAFALRYPEYVNHNPETFYHEDLFGPAFQNLFLHRDNFDQRQLDIGVARTTVGQGVNGYGRVAKINFASDFIIIIDIIERTGNNAVPFTIPVQGVRAIDPAGNIKDLSVPLELDTVWLKLQETTNASDPSLAEKVAIYPNPATDVALLLTGDLEVEQIEAVNTLGQTLYSMPPSGERTTRLDVGGWQAGLYTLRIQTKQGMVEKRLVVK